MQRWEHVRVVYESRSCLAKVLNQIRNPVQCWIYTAERWYPAYVTQKGLATSRRRRRRPERISESLQED